MISKLKELWNAFGVWRQTRLMEKEIDASISPPTVVDNIHWVQDEQQYKYQEGMALVKKQVKEAAKTSGYDKTLRKFGDLLTLAKGPEDSSSEIKQMILGGAVHDKADVKTDDDKTNMVDDRIKHYKELQHHKEERAKRRLERRKDGKDPRGNSEGT